MLVKMFIIFRFLWVKTKLITTRDTLAARLQLKLFSPYTAKVSSKNKNPLKKSKKYSVQCSRTAIPEDFQITGQFHNRFRWSFFGI